MNAVPELGMIPDDPIESSGDAKNINNHSW
jgi:hypothetical protein